MRNPNSSTPLPATLCALAVMTKAPRAGQVKTRLVPPLTPEEAAQLNVCFLRDITSSIEMVTQNHNAYGVAVYTPVGSESAYNGVLPDSFSFVAQRGDSFGQRLLFATEDLLRLGFESVCLINSDSPTVPARYLAEAVEYLSRPGDRIVLGPSDDGGYYLIGLKKLHRRVFENIDWSTAKVLEQTRERAAELLLDVHLLPAWFDVDDRGTLQRLCKSLLESEESDSAPATQDFLRDLISRPDRSRILPNE